MHLKIAKLHLPESSSTHGDGHRRQPSPALRERAPAHGKRERARPRGHKTSTDAAFSCAATSTASRRGRFCARSVGARRGQRRSLGGSGHWPTCLPRGAAAASLPLGCSRIGGVSRGFVVPSSQNTAAGARFRGAWSARGGLPFRLPLRVGVRFLAAPPTPTEVLVTDSDSGAYALHGRAFSGPNGPTPHRDAPTRLHVHSVPAIGSAP